MMIQFQLSFLSKSMKRIKVAGLIAMAILYFLIATHIRSQTY